MPALNVENMTQTEKKKVAVCGGGLVIFGDLKNNLVYFKDFH